MVFNDNESLTSLYGGITKQVTPSEEQLTRQSPILSNTGLSKDMDVLQEAYDTMTNKGVKKCACKYAAKGCDCGGCEECKANQEEVHEAKKLSPAQKKIAQAAPPPDEITGADFKALAKKKMKESSDFKSLFMSIISES